MTEIKKIRILIADDFKVLRDVIRLYRERAGDMGVIGEAPDLNDALERAQTLQPDVIILNDYLPPVDSAYAAALFRERGIEAAILTISMDIEPDLVHRSLRSGINGFIHKDEINVCIVDAILSIHQGKRYLSPRAQEAYDRSPE